MSRAFLKDRRFTQTFSWTHVDIVGGGADEISRDGRTQGLSLSLSPSVTPLVLRKLKL
jgi:hypothetical protein